MCCAAKFYECARHQLQEKTFCDFQVFKARKLLSQFLSKSCLICSTVSLTYVQIKLERNYRMHGLFGDDFNLAVQQIFVGSPNLNHTISKIHLCNSRSHAIASS